jgi:hypothetical protein
MTRLSQSEQDACFRDILTICKRLGWDVAMEPGTSDYLRGMMIGTADFLKYCFIEPTVDTDDAC